MINYNLERQQLGRNTWKKIGMIPGVPHYKDTDVDHGRKYCYRIRAISTEGASEIMETDDIQAGTKGECGRDYMYCTATVMLNACFLNTWKAWCSSR